MRRSFVVGITVACLTCFTSKSNAFKYSEGVLRLREADHGSKMAVRKRNVKRQTMTDSYDDEVNLIFDVNQLNSTMPSSSPSSKPTLISTSKPTSKNPTPKPTSKAITDPTTKPTPVSELALNSSSMSTSTTLSPMATRMPLTTTQTLTSSPPRSSNSNMKPTSAPTSTNRNTTLVKDLSPQTILNQSNQEDNNQPHFSAASQAQASSMPFPVIISTVCLAVVCLIGIGVAITAWILGGPEEHFEEKSAASDYQPSFFERMIMSSNSEPKSPAPSSREINEYQTESKPTYRKRRERRERRQRKKNSDNGTQDEAAISDYTPFNWFDRFLDGTINKVC